MKNITVAVSGLVILGMFIISGIASFLPLIAMSVFIYAVYLLITGQLPI